LNFAIVVSVFHENQEMATMSIRLAATCAGLFLTLGAFTAQPAKPLPQSAPQATSLTEKPAPPISTPSSSSHPLTAPDVESFFDGILPLQLERSDIAGASVLVMQGDQVLLKKGYGYADLKTKKAVDPNSTIFRLASISKLFTWVSIMQLVEEGKLDLDTDINRYLDFQIRPKFNQPITLRNLMTHTAGFEEFADDIILTDPKKAISLRDDLIQNQPERIFPPGKIPAYSNYGVGLASYIVQRTSGEPFEQYVQEHIFAPLGMSHSSFEQPLPKSLASLPSEGYRQNTTKPPVGFEIFNPVGAGGISSSAADMGRFGQALLHGGELDGKHILKPETLAQMWTPQFRASDQMPPICMGFYQDWRNNLRWIGHEGDLVAFHSLFFLEPTQKVLLFVSYNSAGGGDKPRPEIINMFSDRYFPDYQPPAFIKTPVAELKAIEGTYETTRRSDSTKLAAGNLFGQREVTVDKDGNMTFENAKNLRGHPIKYKPIGKDLWQDADGQGRAFAIRDASGKVVRIAGNFPGVQLQRVPWYENQLWMVPALIASLAVLTLVVIAALVRLGRRIFLRKRTRWTPQPGTIWLTAAPQWAAFGWIVLLGTILSYAAAKSDDLLIPSPAWYPWLEVINIATGIILIFSLFAVITGIRIWTRANLRWITKVKFSLVALALVVMSWFAIHWNIIGPAHRI
jgi:CubicO group peptidase (beta-lactamase class C family)